MKRIVECVPNVSEGKNPEILESLKAAVQSHRGVVLLDSHMDSDHHRSVLTFAGEPESVAEAAFEVVRLATDLIDLTGHQGQHPRIGATDVLPFVPVCGTTMEECVTLAKRVGVRIGTELKIPVFLYGEASSMPERRNVEHIRFGGLNALTSRMATDRRWRPDFGPSKPHPTAGAIAVGARRYLIAYNVVLQSSDVTMAKAIAKQIRTSGGGLPALKAIGVELTSRGVVQVSMNLVNFHETPIHVAFEAVKHEADRLGIAIAESEIVGLVPQEALTQTAAFYLKCHGLNVGQVLETRLAMEQDNDITMTEDCFP